MPEKQLHCDSEREALANKNVPDTEKAVKMPEHRQVEYNEPSNDEIRRDRYRMR